MFTDKYQTQTNLQNLAECPRTNLEVIPLLGIWDLGFWFCALRGRSPSIKPTGTQHLTSCHQEVVTVMSVWHQAMYHEMIVILVVNSRMAKCGGNLQGFLVFCPMVMKLMYYLDSNCSLRSCLSLRKDSYNS